MKYSTPLILIVCVSSHFSLRAATSEGTPLFERDILPIFSAHCWKCHGMEARKAGLDLRTPPLTLRGSDNGPVVVKGSPAQSVLFQKLTSKAMPPAGELSLHADQIETVRRWIEGGAQSARTYDNISKMEAGSVSDEDRQFWSFRTLHPAIPPSVPGDRVQTPIDRFIVARLQEKGLSLAPPADRRTFIRRVYADLIGFPPSPEEVEAFVADSSPDAVDRLVDGLLASPHFGERWGRHWLDAAGHTDVHGIDTNVSIIRAGDERWRYRDYVVRAFNEDKPYDQFLKEQLAGDELVDWRTAEKFTPEIISKLEATGFLRTAADDTDNNELNIALIRYRVLQLTLQNLTSNVLGLTVGCAQCHTHKYDPIPQVDYYRMMAIFLPAYNPQSWLQTKNRVLADVPPAERAAVDRHNEAVDKKIKPLKERLDAIRKPYEARLLDAKLADIPEPLRIDTRAALNTPVKKRTELDKYLVRKLGMLVKPSLEETKAALEPQDRQSYEQIEAEIATLEKEKHSYRKITALYDVGPPPPAYLLRRGNHETPAAEIQPGFLTVLTEPGKPLTIPSAPDGSPTSGRRLALANWLTEPGTPASALTARVMVNRMWQYLFGEGIVNPSDNFGHAGSLPTHPELLEWLASEFVRGGWRIKPLLKLMLTSSVYQQASHRDDGAAMAAVDPGNQLLWRMRLRRLESEAIRDSILTVAGKLDPTIGGPPVKMDYRADGMVTVDPKDLRTSTEKWRRGLYLFQRRSYNMTMLTAFDQPVMDTNCVRRNSSAVVLQSLAMLNDGFILEQAAYLADRVIASAGATPGERIAQAYRIVFGRSPSDRERSWSHESFTHFVDRYRTAGETAEAADRKALAALCHTILNTNEFLYVE